MLETNHLTTKQLAARWSLSPGHLTNLRWAGQGPRYLKLSGRVLYRLEDVQEYEAARLVEAVAGR